MRKNNKYYSLWTENTTLTNDFLDSFVWFKSLLYLDLLLQIYDFVA